LKNYLPNDHRDEARSIEIGMVVEADEGDLGQEDISEATVTDVIYDQAGDVELIRAEKGTVFRKELDIPVDRIQSVTQRNEADGSDRSTGKVIFSAREDEV
jgi:hypothetical protein